MKNYENDPSMPWNQSTWLDTFWKNKAFENNAMDMVVAMNEKRKDDAADLEAAKEAKRRSDEAYVNVVSMLLNLKPGNRDA